jgi:acyl-CoA reductase-like NAD-dependent aldehyde dehydrogenase
MSKPDCSVPPSFQDIVNPWTGEIVQRFPVASARDVCNAINRAERAFDRARRSTSAERSEILHRTSELILSSRNRLVSVIVAEAGKPLALAEAEVDRAAATFRFAAAEAIQYRAEGLAIDASAAGRFHWGCAVRFPIGTILGITPFNFPLNLAAHKVAPAIASGNTILLKPAPQAPTAARILEELLGQAGLPEGQCQVLLFPNDQTETVLAHPSVAMLSFTGSVPAGWHLKQMAVRQKSTLELGGNAAVVIEPDSDWEDAIPLIARAAFGYAGQSCISVQRILVHSSIREAFCRQFVDWTRTHVVSGDPGLVETLVGPMISPSARERAISWSVAALRGGAKALLTPESHGYALSTPGIFEDVSLESPLWTDEAFAPVVAIKDYTDFDEALRLVNSSRFGLQAGVFTPRLDRALKAHSELRVGGVLINQVPTFRVENMPYGGVKDSGTGREGVRYAMEEMTDIRSLVVRLPPEVSAS